MSANTRPAWMEGGTPKTTRPSAANSRPIIIEDAAPTTTHRDVVVGVVILTTLALLSTFFWLGFVATLVIVPAHGAALTDGWRLAVSAVVAIVGSVLAWKVADGLVA